MKTCHDIGIAGNCGLDCEVYLSGGCDEAESMGEDLAGEDLLRHVSIYGHAERHGMKRVEELDVVDGEGGKWKCYRHEPSLMGVYSLVKWEYGYCESKIGITPETIQVVVGNYFDLDDLEPVFARAREIKEVLKKEES